MLDIRKKLQDKANEIVNEAIDKSGENFKEVPWLDDFLKSIVAMSLQQGFIFGVSAMKQTSEVMLKDIKGEDE